MRLLTNHLHDEEGVGTGVILEAADRLEKYQDLTFISVDGQEAISLKRFDELAEDGDDRIEDYFDLSKAKRST